MSRHPYLFLVVAVLLLGATREAELPKCSGEGQVLVWKSGAYQCEGLAALLQESRSSGSWGIELLLPSCSSDSFLVSEGFGKWKCVDKAALLPSCSSGEFLRSEGSGRWRCERGMLPSCSSGEILVSEGSGDWRCHSR